MAKLPHLSGGSHLLFRFINKKFNVWNLVIMQIKYQMSNNNVKTLLFAVFNFAVFMGS